MHLPTLEISEALTLPTEEAYAAYMLEQAVQFLADARPAANVFHIRNGVKDSKQQRVRKCRD